MKRAKIYIGESATSDYKYNIYKFKNEPAQMDLDAYTNINPIAVIDEASNDKPIEYGEISDYVAFINDRGEDYDFVSYSAPFDFIFKQDFVIFHIGGNGKTKADKIIELYTSKVSASRFVYKRLEGDKYITEFETTNVNEIKKHAIIESASCVALHKSYTDGYSFESEIRLGVHTRRLYYTDYDSNGIYKPEYKAIERMKEWELYPIQVNGNLYHYTAIATDGLGRTSDVSNIASVMLLENPNEIDMDIEYSDDYYRDGGTWRLLDTVKASNSYLISKDDMYTREIPKFNASEIKADDSNIQVYHERLLRVPNVWHRDRNYLSYRKNRAYRLRNKMKGEFSEYSEVFFNDGYSKVNIDKMTIYKKNVTSLSAEDKKIPIEIGDNDAEILKIFIRVGGIFYRDAIENIDTEPIEILSDNSRLPLINIKDRCFYSNQYNYTVYLYDEMGNKSKPYSIVI